MNAKKLLAVTGAALMSAAAMGAGEPTITMHRVQQRYPWNGKIDIDYTVENVPAGSEADYYVRFKITENGRTHILHKMLDSSMLAEASNGTYRVTWDSARESDEYHFFDKRTDFKAELVYCGLDRSSMPYGNLYIVVDLSAGATATAYPVTREYLDFDAATNKFNTAEYKTNKLVLREIMAGTFIMGSPKEEYGHQEPTVASNPFCFETQHQVTLSGNYLFGIFPITQAQYAKVMGTNPANFKNDEVGNPAAERPVETVSYQMVRGTNKGIQRPATFGNTDANSFCGILSAKAGLTFDLPTEAEWEYACRAGTTTSTYAGEMTQQNAGTLLPTIAWYGGYSTKSFAVGQKLPNAWAIYDTLGGIWEWCRDRVSNALANLHDDPGSNPVTDPLCNSGDNVIDRGGGMVESDPTHCRAAIRGADSGVAKAQQWYGFRISARFPQAE